MCVPYIINLFSCNHTIRFSLVSNLIAFIHSAIRKINQQSKSNIFRIITKFSWYCFWGVFILILAGIFELQRKKLLKYGAKTHKKIKLVSFLFSNKCKRSKIQGLYLKI